LEEGKRTVALARKSKEERGKGENKKHELVCDRDAPAGRPTKRRRQKGKRVPQPKKRKKYANHIKQTESVRMVGRLALRVCLIAGENSFGGVRDSGKKLKGIFIGFNGKPDTSGRKKHGASQTSSRISLDLFF